MTDRPPQYILEPSEPDDKTACKLLQQIMRDKFIECGGTLKLPEAVMHAKQLGNAFLRPFWNEERLDGLGDIDFEVVDPLECFPLAYTKSLPSGDGFIWARWVSIGYVRRKYPNGGSVKPTRESENPGVPDRCRETTGTDIDGYHQVTETTGSQTYYLPRGGSSYSLNVADYERVLLIHCFLRHAEDY